MEAPPEAAPYVCKHVELRGIEPLSTSAPRAALAHVETFQPLEGARPMRAPRYSAYSEGATSFTEYFLRAPSLRRNFLPRVTPGTSSMPESAMASLRASSFFWK